MNFALSIFFKIATNNKRTIKIERLLLNSRHHNCKASTKQERPLTQPSMLENSICPLSSPFFEHQGIDCVTPLCEEPQTPTSLSPMHFDFCGAEQAVKEAQCAIRVTRSLPQFQSRCLKYSSNSCVLQLAAEKKKPCSSISLSVVACSSDMFAATTEPVSKSARPVEKVSSVQLCKILDGALSKRKELLCKRSSNNSNSKKPKLSIRTQ